MKDYNINPIDIDKEIDSLLNKRQPKQRQADNTTRIGSIAINNHINKALPVVAISFIAAILVAFIAAMAFF